METDAQKHDIHNSIDIHKHIRYLTKKIDKRFDEFLLLTQIEDRTETIELLH